MSPKIVDKEARRKEIVSSAMQVIAAKGIKNIKMDEIAEAAGIGKGTIYEYFSSKEELFGASINAFMQHIEDGQAKRMYKATTPSAKLRAILDGWIDATLHEDTDLMTLMIDVWAEGIRRDNAELAKVFDLNAIYHQYLDIVAAIIEDGIRQGDFREINARAMAGIFIASVDGLMIQWCLDTKNYDLHKGADCLYDMFMNGISSKNTAMA